MIIPREALGSLVDSKTKNGDTGSYSLCYLGCIPSSCHRLKSFSDRKAVSSMDVRRSPNLIYPSPRRIRRGFSIENRGSPHPASTHCRSYDSRTALGLPKTCKLQG